MTAWGSATEHQRYSVKRESRRRGRRKCSSACPNPSHAGMANGLCLMIGCEFHVAMWVRSLDAYHRARERSCPPDPRLERAPADLGTGLPRGLGRVMRNGQCHHPRRRQRKRLEFCCAWQGQIRANGWLEVSNSYRSLFAWLRKRWHWPCSSPRRHQCRTGTTRPGRDQDPARWTCTGRELFLGPLMWDPIDSAVWYERANRS